MRAESVVLQFFVMVCCRYIVLMSDGIFEFLDSQQVMEEVHAAAKAGQSPSEAAKRLVRLARK
jgi:serine/threonine protein phosphatase PrpC